MGVNTWLNEQTAREAYLEVADKAVVDGGSWCTMSGFNRWGATWCGKYENLQTGYLRDELGYDGIACLDWPLDIGTLMGQTGITADGVDILTLP